MRNASSLPKFAPVFCAHPAHLAAAPDATRLTEAQARSFIMLEAMSKAPPPPSALAL
ncbi:hypothetical protein PSAC2689_50013 [Paraburkholderia sacchari]